MQRGFLWALLVPSLLLCASNLFEENQPQAPINTCMERIEIKNSQTHGSYLNTENKEYTA